MLDVYWLEQSEADVPKEDDWLNASEAARVKSMRFTKRRADWRLGRWTAKRALALSLNMPRHPKALAGIEIRPAQSGAPEVFFTSQPVAVTVSISHRGGSAVCAVALSAAALGCDLEVVEPRSEAFMADYFTAEEQAWVAQGPAADRSRLLALLWSGKESALKALREGLRLDTRCVTVTPVEASCSGDPDGWRPLHVGYGDGQTFHGWWQQTGDRLRTLVAAPPPGPPILLKPSS